VEELNTLKRADLQKLAKLHGIKANKKNAAIIKDLVECFNQQLSEEHVHAAPLIKPAETVKDICAAQSNDATFAVIDKISMQCGKSDAKTESPKQVASILQPAASAAKIPASKTPVAKAPAAKTPRSIDSDKKPINFKQIHQKYFERMESIDDYIAKKRQRAKQLRFTVKEAANDAVEVLSSMKRSHDTPRNTVKDGKLSKIPRLQCKSIDVKAKVDSCHARGSQNKLFGLRSPPPFEGLKSNSAVKKFNLEESLKKPLTYKPHSGKLRGLNERYTHADERLTQRHVNVKTMKRSQVDKRMENCLRSQDYSVNQ